MPSIITLSPKDDFPPHLPRNIPPLNLAVAGVAAPPDFLAHLPRRNDVVHTLARLQMPEHRSCDVAVDVFDGFTGRREKRPDQGGHGATEDDDAEAGLEGLLGGSLDFGGCAGVGENGAVEEDEARLPVGLGVVEDRLQARIICGVFRRHYRCWDLGDPLVQRQVDAGGVGFEIRSHVVGFVVARAGHLFLVQVTLDVDQACQSMYDGP